MIFLVWGKNVRAGAEHLEWHWQCDPDTGYGCGFHPTSCTMATKGAHVHECVIHAGCQP